MWEDFQRELSFLRIESSHALVMEPDGNGCAERFIRVLKEDLLWMRSFQTIEELGQALLEFKDMHNNTWIMERHGYKTPALVRKERLRSLSRAA
jgi:transposase InsO family protein